MKKYNVEFIKDRKGQKMFKRSITWESITVLMIMADDVQVNYRSKKNIHCVFTWHKPGMNVYARVMKLKQYEAERILAMAEWTNSI
jgi:hypothetical protein